MMEATTTLENGMRVSDMGKERKNSLTVFTSVTTSKVNKPVKVFSFTKTETFTMEILIATRNMAREITSLLMELESSANIKMIKRLRRLEIYQQKKSLN